MRNQINTKKKWLGRYQAKIQYVSWLRDRLQEVEIRILLIKSPVYNNQPGVGNTKSIEDYIIDKTSLEARIDRGISIAQDIKGEICQAIATVTDPVSLKILEDRYINGFTIDEISESLGYSVRHTQRLYAKAIDEIEIDLSGV